MNWKNIDAIPGLSRDLKIKLKDTISPINTHIDKEERA
jgi:hypothetical protein